MPAEIVRESPTGLLCSVPRTRSAAQTAPASAVSSSTAAAIVSPMRQAASHSRNVRRTTAPRTPSAWCWVSESERPTPSSSKITTDTGWSWRRAAATRCWTMTLKNCCSSRPETGSISGSESARSAADSSAELLRVASSAKMAARASSSRRSRARSTLISWSCSSVVRVRAPSAVAAMAASSPKKPLSTASSGIPSTPTAMPIASEANPAPIENASRRSITGNPSARRSPRWSALCGFADVPARAPRHPA